MIDGIEYNYYFVDTNVVNGMHYTYSITAYDMGVEADFVIDWIADGNGGFNPDTVWSNANPEHWSSPNGYQSLETSRGTTILDPNYVQIYPGVHAQDITENIKVVPNPYISRSNFNEDKYIRRIRFTNLPSVCTISIFTISGEQVFTLNHQSEMDGNEWWDLRTINNQEIAPGLYVYVVQAEGADDFIGKFAVVR